MYVATTVHVKISWCINFRGFRGAFLIPTKINPFQCKNNEQTAEIFLGTWPTISPSFCTCTANGSKTFPVSLVQLSNSP